MYPLLAKIGPVPIHTYGFMIAIGFLVGVYVARKLAVRAQIDPERTLDMAFWALLVGFAGCRILFIITRLDYFLADPLAMFKIWEGGLVFFGGPILVIPFIWWYTRRHKLPLGKTLDVLTPPLVIAHMFGRFGCLAAGCCYGKPTGTNFGVRLYSDLVDPALRGIPLHPTQLYEAGSLFILFWGLLYVFKHKTFNGQVTVTYLMAYPIIRSIIEIFRGDSIRGFVIDNVLSTSQFISILVFLAASLALYILHKRAVASGGLREHRPA
jgi:phosphatidylglycerol:prolipoprotein diacylglycerol transferase